MLEGVDCILHAGDCVSERVLDELSGLAPVYAVAGNMDHALGHLPVKREFEWEGVRLGMIHGSGFPRDALLRLLPAQFERVRVIIYGHTHEPFWGEYRGVWFMNPGSPTDRRFAPYPSLGILTLRDGHLQGRLWRLEPTP